MKIEFDVSAKTFVSFMDCVFEAEWDSWPKDVQELREYLMDTEYKNANYIIKNKIEK